MPKIISISLIYLWCSVQSAVRLLFFRFIIYGRFASADTAANKVAIRSVKMTKITTGTSTFDSSDGLNYSDTNLLMNFLIILNIQ